VVAAAAALGVTLLAGNDDGDASAPTTSPAAPTAAPTTLAPTTTLPSIDSVGSLWWLVNRDRPLPDGYVPPDLVTPSVPLKPDTGATQVTAATAAAFEAMLTDAATAGFQLQLNSGYRSYEQQQMLYDRFVEDYGAEVAAQRVAPPGTSEHQTGLAADVGLVGLPDDQLFGDTEASVWVADHAHEYGFIIRYPPDKAHITGYDNEPWHLRYVGVELATQLHASGLTMEEHFGLVR
jgi:D-alanyl-D-alanine carboxypeptidase